MNTNAHLLSFWSGLCLLVIGNPGWFPGPAFLPPSWRQIWEILPVWLDIIWPGVFVVAAILLLAGGFSTRAMIPGFLLGAIAYTVWGGMPFYVWASNRDGSIPGSMTYVLVTGYMSYIAITAHRDRRLDAKVADIERAEIQEDTRVELQEDAKHPQQ